MKKATNIGVQFLCHPKMEQSEAKSSLSLIKEKGIDFIRIEIAWHYCEPRDSVYDFSNVLEIIKIASEFSLKVELVLNMETIPSWLLQEAEIFSMDVSPYPADKSKMPCWENPLVLNSAEHYIKAFVRKVGKSSTVTNWVIRDDEYLWQQKDLFTGAKYCNCSHTLDAFREWLKNKYKTFETLNDNLNQNYSDWSHIFPNAGINPLANEWVRFFTGRRSIVNQIFLSLIKKYDKASRPVRIGQLGNYTGNETCSGTGTANRDNNHSLNGKGNSSGSLNNIDSNTQEMSVVEALTASEVCRCAAAGGPWTAELPAGRQAAGLRRWSPPSQRSLSSATFASLARGASQLLFPSALDDKLISFIKSNDKFIAACESDHSDVAIWVNNDSHILASQSGEQTLVRDSVINLHSTLIKRSVFPDILYDILESNLSKYKLIFLPAPFIVNEKQALKLTNYVSNGGMLVSDGLIATFDQVSNPSNSSNPSDSSSSSIISDLFGCIENDYISNPMHVSLIGVDEFSLCSVSAKFSLQTFSLTTGKVAFKYKEAIAGVSNSYGKGTTLLLGTLFSLDKVNDDFIGLVLDIASIKSLNLKVIVQSLLSDDFWVVFAFNKEGTLSNFVLEETNGYELVESFGCQIDTETFRVTVDGNSSGCIIFQRNKTELN